MLKCRTRVINRQLLVFTKIALENRPADRLKYVFLQSKLFNNLFKTSVKSIIQKLDEF